MIQLIDYLKERPKAVRYILVGVAIAVFIWSMTVNTHHAHTWAEKIIPGFWSIFGFISCLVLIFFSRWLTKAGVSREEDYYDN